MSNKIKLRKLLINYVIYSNNTYYLCLGWKHAEYVLRELKHIEPNIKFSMKVSNKGIILNLDDMFGSIRVKNIFNTVKSSVPAFALNTDDVDFNSLSEFLLDNQCLY